MTENNKGDWAVLFVDDEEKALKYFAKAVGKQFNVLTAADVESAEEVLKTKGDQIAIVISDQRMPGKNGVELLKTVRAEYPAMVRMLTTAYSDLNDAIEAINRGEIYRYIQKPWHLESLQAEVKGAMDYFLLRRERDLLLAEKLSARQRLTAVDRLGKLTVFANSLVGLRDADYALKHFLNYLHRLPGTRESDGIGNVDQWELTKWESRRISDYLQLVSRSLPEPGMLRGQQEPMSGKTLAELNNQLAGEYDLELAVDSSAAPNLEWQTDRITLEALFANVFALIKTLRPQRLASLTLGSDAQNAAMLNFRIEGIDWPTERHLLSGSALTDVHPLYQQLLAASLAAAHLGGSSSLELQEDVLLLTFKLPAAAAQSRSELGWDWLPDALSYYEPDIDEFYDNL